jgi:hypothetical protein
LLAAVPSAAVAIGVEKAHALIARTARWFEALDQEDAAVREAALAAVFDALDEFLAVKPVAPDDPDFQLWTRAATLAEGVEELCEQATQRPFSAGGFQTAQLATYGALLQAQGQFEERPPGR